MESKKLWLFVIFLGLFQIIFECVIYFKKESKNLLFFISDIIGTSFTIFLFGLVFALLLSLIPINKLSFKEKFKIVLPTIILIIISLSIIFSLYSKYLKSEKGFELRPIHKL